MKQAIKNYFEEIKILLRSLPSGVFGCFVTALFAMNLLANKSISLPWENWALDCGIILSWAVFLAMDVITKHYGPRAATQISCVAAAINLGFCVMLFLGSLIPGEWSQSFVFGSEQTINDALDKTFGGTWYVLLGSTVAFVVSAAINNFTNWGIGKLFKKNPDGVAAYASRTYVSTAVAQFADNLIFALIVSHFFFGWSITQCVTCATTGMAAELLFEIVFSFFGFRTCKKWKEQQVGEQYFRFMEAKKSK